MAGYSPPWSKFEIDFLMKNYKEMTAKEIGIKLNKSIDAVKCMRKKLNLKKGPRYRWPSGKVIKNFKIIRKNLKATPTYHYLESNYPGMLMAIERDYGSYNKFLFSLKIKPNLVQKKWNRKKCLEEFQKIMEKFNLKKPPTVKKLNRIIPGISRGIYRYWGSYKDMLKQLDLHPNFEVKWSKKKCIDEFGEVLKEFNKIPTTEILRQKRPDLLGAIYKHYGSYSQLLKSFGLKTKFRNWNKEKCVNEFKKIMKKQARKKPFSIAELYEIDSKLIAAIYRYFESYNKFVVELGYEPNYGCAADYWLKWENFVIKVCKQVYKNCQILIKKSLINRKVPDVIIIKNGKIYKIIDAKTTLFCSGMRDDIKNYKPFCTVLEFWGLHGQKKSSRNVRFLSVSDIRKLLAKHNKLKLLEELSSMEIIQNDR